MSAESESKSETNREQAADHLASVHLLLKALQDKIGEHPLLAEAILKVEMALNTLGVKTAGML
jgi:vacuolar-type H+-ATPase subunit I/STV1